MQSPLLVYPLKRNGTYCQFSLLHVYLEVNSRLQLTISPTFLSLILSPVGNPSGSVVLFFRKIFVVVVIWLFLRFISLCTTVSLRLHLQLDSLVSFPEQKMFDCPYSYRKQYVTICNFDWLFTLVGVKHFKSNLPKVLENT